MEEKTIFLLRHGETVGAGGTRRFIGQLDVPLSDEGRTQMRRMGELLAAESIGTIFSSDLQRSRESAALIARACGKPVNAIPKLREIAMGDWEGLTCLEARERHPVQFAARESDIIGFRPPGGESFRDCADRALPAFDRIAESFGPIVIVGHAGLNRIILCRILGMPLENLFLLSQDFGRANRIRARAAGMRVESLNAAAI